MKELSSTICRWHTTNWAWCTRSASTVPQSHPNLSSTMARRAASCPWKEVLMNTLCPLNCLLVLTSVDSQVFPYEAQTWNSLHMQGMPTISKTQTHTEDQMEDPTSIELPHLGYPTTSAWTWMEDQTSIILMHTYHLNLLASSSNSSNVRMTPSQTGPFMLHMMEQLLSSKNSMQTCVPHSGYQIHPPYWPPLQSEPQVTWNVKHYTNRKIK